MAKKKRTGLDALREYEAGSNYAASSATSYGQTQTQTKSTSFKRSGLDALREYEQYRNPGTVQDTAFDPNYRSRNYQTQAGSAAFEAYKNALSATKKTPTGTVSGKVTEQEYGRSPAMQQQYGTYQNYLRGVDAVQGRQIGTQALRQQSALLAGQFAPATQKTREDVNALNRRTRAEQNTQRDQVRGMRRTSKELGKQIEALEEEQADAHFAADGRSASGKSPTQLQDEINALQDRKNLVDSQSVLERARDAMRGLSEEDQNLLRQYRGQELNGYQVRAYAKYDAKKALNEKGYSDDTLKRLAEWQKVLDDYDNAQKLDQAAQEMGSGSFAGKAAATLFSAALAPGKALGNVESLRGVLPSWAGGYQNEDMPTNIYSPAYNASRLSSGIRQSVMQDMNPTGQFLYQAGTSALDSAVNMAVSTGLVGTVGGAAGAGAKDAIAETMNWVMGSQVAADSVYEGIQNGKSNADALVDGIVEGAIEGITEKYSVGDIIENMLSGKAVWRKALRSFASEGAEEIASNWLNRAYDVVAKHDRGEVMTAYANYIAEGKTPAQALAAMVGDFAKEDSLSFLAGGLSGLAMSGTYAGVNRVILEANVTQTARAVIEAGEVQDVIDYGMAQEEGTKAHQLAEELQKTVDDGGEVTQKAVEDTLREVAREQQAAVDEGEEPRVPEKLTRLEQLQQEAAQEQAQADTQERTYQIYKDAVQSAQEAARAAQEYASAEQEQRQQQETGTTAQQRSGEMRAAQRAQRAAEQAQYDQGSLLSQIPGTEEIGELDPEQYARQQTVDAEQALDEAALQQEEQYLQTQAQRAGYDEQTAAYFLNGNTTGLPAEQYAASFERVYEQGRLGASEKRAMRYAEGMNQDVAAAAYRAGLAAGQKGVNNGSIEVTDEGQVGQAGQRAEGQAGGVRQSTAQQQRADTGRKRAQGARDLAKAWDEVELSTLGFGKDNTQKVRVMPKGQEARSEDIQAAEKFFRSMGVQNARFFTGQLTQEIDGQTFYADAAVTEDGSVLIRADSEEYSAFELAKHEGYHLLVKRWPEMAAKIQKRLLGEGKITKEMIESYVDAYAGIYGDDTDAYVEEIIADTYAGMNRTDYGTNQLRADVKMEVGQWQKKSGSARAPPVKMSASKAEKYDFTKPFAEQVDDWKAGKIGKNDTLVVGPTPEVFQKVGFNALPVTINQTHVDYALNGTKDEEHHIGEPMLKQLPRAMKSPVAIIASESQRGTSVVALLPFIKDAKSVIIPVYIDGFGRQNSIVIDSNAVTSIYEKKNAVTGLLTNAIKKSNNGETTLFYVDKVKAAALYQVARVPMPKMPDTDNGFVASIRDEGSTVKPKLKNVTQSQQFKRWFGDWQNHPESASKVVNADGTPKVVYHGTNAEFNTFQQENGAYFFSESRDYAESMADERRGNRVIEAYLKMKNPYTVKLPPGQFTDNIAEAPVIRYAKEHGNDGVIFEYDGSKEDLAYDKFYVVFDSAQIKSATDNIGTFDKTNPDIRFSASARQETKMSDETDAAGTKLSERQAKFFADSQVRTEDADQKLLPVYHSTYGEFTVFNRRKLGENALGNAADASLAATALIGHWFSDHDASAKIGGKAEKYYLNIKNPYETSLDGLAEEIGAYAGDYADVQEAYEYGEYGQTRQMARGFVKFLRRNGYDGLIVSDRELGGTSYVALDANQIKRTDNLSPTKKNDIRFSASAQPTKEDQRYLEAIERGDAETVQRMVDDAATMAGYTVDAYHGTQQFGFTEFLREKSDNGGAFYFTNEKSVARTYAGSTAKVREIAENANPEELRERAIEEQTRRIEIAKKKKQGVIDKIKNKTIDEVAEELKKERNKEEGLYVESAEAVDPREEVGKLAKWVAQTAADNAKETAPETVEMAKRLEENVESGDYEEAKEIAREVKKAWYEAMYAEGSALDYEDAEAVGDLIRAMQFVDAGEKVIKLIESDSGAPSYATYYTRQNVIEEMTQEIDEEIEKIQSDRYLDEWIRYNGEKGLYHAKIDLGESLEIKANGAAWNNIKTRLPGSNRYIWSTRSLEREAEALGYDSLVVRDILDMGGRSNDKAKTADVFVIFDSNRIKSADPVVYDDSGNVIPLSERFNPKKTDIRWSSQDGRYRDLMGEKAAQYVRRLESRLVNELAENLSVPGQAKREVLRPMAEEALRSFFTDGQLDRAKLNDLFETAYQAGIEEDTQYIEQYGDLKKFIRDQRISISEKDRQDIADYNLFRKAAMGTLTISKDGLPVDVAYQQLQEMAPELFPADITAPSDQLMQIYDVARGIQKVQKTLDEYYGPQAASFKKWQQANFTESIDRLTSGLRVAQRYLDAQNKAKEKLAIPQTAEETKQMWAQLKDARRVVEKAQSKTLLTEADQKIVNRLLRGETSPDYVAGLENGQQILKVYEAKADYDMLALKLKAWNAQRKQGLRDFAEQALTEAEAVKWADKTMGIRYQRETMERNIRDIARKGKVSDEKANAFINKYFWPVHENESKRKNYVVAAQEKIRALKLDRQVRKGNMVSESYAVQWLGEAEFNRDYLKQHPRVERRGGMTFDEWNAAIQDFEKQNPDLDLGKVREAVKVFHEVYDKLFQDMNRVRIENGYEPVNYLQGYFPHFQENEEGGNILQKFARAAGIEGDVSPLPATINGLTANFKPGIRYMANIQNRLGYATAYDALQGFDRYIEVATDVIFHTADIQRLRALATQIRYRASDEGLKQRIDAIMMNPFLNPDEANEQVTNLTKEGRYGLSNFVDELDEYTNLLAGKKSRLDRGMEKLMGRRFYNVMKKFESRVGANMVAANVGSALTNFIPITQAWSQVSTADVLRGMWDTLKNYKTADGLDSASTFINNRSGYGRLAMSTMDKVSEKAGILMEVVDRFTTGSVVRARYYQNLQRGMSEISAMQEADQFAAGVMADRSKGSTPTLYSARNPLVKLFTQFQLEVNNELSWIFKDMAQEERKKGVAALAKAMFKFLIGAWIYNEFYESIVGRRPALDPLDIINDTVGDFTGYHIPNMVLAGIGAAKGEKIDFTTEKQTTDKAIAGVWGRVLSEAPSTQALTILGLDEAMGIEIDNGRIAVASALPDIGKLRKAIWASNEDMAPAKKAKTITDELIKPGLYLATPFGGGQIRKAYQGATAAARGGSYTVDNEGRDILQYPVYNDNAADRAKSWAQALLFGKTATEEAQSWVESGFKSLSAKETAAYQGMTEGGEDQRETYAFIQAARKLEKNYDKMMLLKAYDISDAAKAEYYYQVLAGDTQKAEMEPKSTQERIDYMNEKIQDAQEARQKQDLKDAVAAGTVTQEKAIQKILANDYAEDEDKAYWLYKEWTGGKDYTKYGKILQTIEDGGDLKAAAKEYFDHGAKKGDIGDAITTEYKPKYIAASPEERKKLKEKLLAAYTAVGFDRSKKSKDIDKWLKDSK